MRCRVTGIEVLSYAAELARANLQGAEATGEVLVGDAFLLSRRAELRGRFDLVYSMGMLERFADVVARISALSLYLKPGGRILTTVPNLQGVNWLLQRVIDLKPLRSQVIYDVRRLEKVHEAAGLRSVAAGYVGWCDGFLTSSLGAQTRLRRIVHRGACTAVGLCAEGWRRATRGRVTPEMRWVAPYVFYVGVRDTGAVARAEVA
jgi:SAM-dependent methyltransferase